MPDSFEDNDFYDSAREVAGDLLEEIKCVDVYNDKKRSRTSKTFRIHYRSLEKTLGNKEVDELQIRLRDHVSQILKVELR